MANIDASVSTPKDLMPRMGNLPISNARYFQSAVITRVTEPPQASVDVPQWKLFGTAQHELDARGNAVEITTVVFSPDGLKLASADSSGVVRLWDGTTLQSVGYPLRDHTGGVASLAFSPDGSLLASVDVIGTLRLWEVTTGQLSQAPIENGADLILKLEFSPEGKLLSRLADGAIALFDPKSGQTAPLSPSLEGDLTTARALFGPRGLQIVVGGGDRSVAFWREGGSVQGIGRQQSDVTSVALSPDGSMGISGGIDGDLKFWRTTTGEVITFATEGVRGHQRTVGDLAFNADGSLFVSAGWDGTVRMWNLDGFQLNDAMTGTPDRFTAVAFSPTSSKFAAGGNDGSITVWFDATHAITRSLSLPKPSSAVAPPDSRPALGVLLTHEQSWTMEGITLGPLLHSVCLAPGEITQLAVSNHTRSVFENSTDAITQREQLSERSRAASTLSEQEKSTASESDFGFSFGNSQSTSSGTRTEGLAGLLGVSAGSGRSSSSAATVSFSSGTRHVADESTQAVHQQTTQAARLSRSRFSASIREVSEADALELRTRVVANYNHMHALTLQYYEVMQVQRLTTTVVDAHRLIFVPMKVIEFSDVSQAQAALQRYPYQIANTLRSLGLAGLATCLTHLMMGRRESQALRQHRINQLWQEAVERRQALEQLTVGTAEKPAALTEAKKRAIATSGAVLSARDALRKAKNKGQSERTALRRIMTQATSTAAVLEAQSALEKIKETGLAERAALQRELRAAKAAAKSAAKALNALELTVAQVSAQVAQSRRLQQALLEILPVSVESSAAGEENSSATGNSLEVAPTIDNDAFTQMENTLYQHLIDNQLAVNQGLWMQLEPATYATLLAGTAFEGRSVAKTLDPTPVAVSGSRVAFRWHHSDPLEAAQFRYEHVGTAQSYQDATTLPTGGVFSEAVLGESNVADTLDITRFWNWKDALPPIRPTEIDALKQPDVKPLAAPTLATAPASSLDLGPITFPEVTSGIPNILDALKNPGLFQDLSGMKTSAALAQSALELTQANATETAEKANQNFKRHLQVQQKVASAAIDAMGTSGDETFDPTLAGAILNANEGKAADQAEKSQAEKTTSQDSPSGEPSSGSPTTSPTTENTTQVSFEAQEP